VLKRVDITNSQNRIEIKKDKEKVGSLETKIFGVYNTGPRLQTRKSH
jgi:hypothetical protein